MDKMESLNPTKWDCKYHVVFIPKNRKKVLYAELRKYLGEVFRSLALQKRQSDRRGTPDGGSRSYDDRDTAQAPGVAGGRVHQGQKCDPLGSGVFREKEKLYRAKFLGPRVLCLDRRTRREDDPRIHPASRAGRRKVGAARAVEVIATE